ncbi:DNA topoisomerase III [Selenomonas sp. AB3002]|uniref:DNA topoisomerase III n=1 Tax=Selenomonas sp. AB3002 TaxID=1392502 RepID=UPI0009070D60
MRLFIAEKPSLAEAIAKGLGSANKQRSCFVCGNDVVTWCYGHILEQFEPQEYDEKYKSWDIGLLPIIPDKWQMKVKANAKEQFKAVKEFALKADIIINAGDPDREGQLLVDEVLNYIGVLSKKPVQRILINALDEKSVHEALKDLRDNREFIGLRNSALARSRADWIIGMNMTRACTKHAEKAGYSSVVSVGRVQTPTLGLVVRREKEIQDFHPVNYFQVKATWQHQQGEIVSHWQIPEDMEGLDADGRLLEKARAEAIVSKVQGQTGVIRKMDQKEGQSQPPLPYSLSALQIAAGKKYGYSPQQVLDTQQELYEKKLTTYPRSDCDYLPTNQLADVPQILDNLGSLSEDFAKFVQGTDSSLRSKAWNDKKISAHHAIVPTTVKANMDELTDMQRNLYEMVAKAYLAQFYPPQKFLTTHIEIEATGETFVANGKVILSPGWKVLYQGEPTNKDGDKEETAQLPAVQNGESVTNKEAELVTKVTKPPKRFTTSTLLAAMKNIGSYVKDKSLKPILKDCSGIGTEATRAGEIELLQERHYLKLEKKELVPTEKAMMIIQLLPDSITYPDITALWEKNLEAISNREMSVQDFFAQQKTYIQQLLEDAIHREIEPPRDIPKCPQCGRPLKLITSKKNGKKYWICTDPERACKSIFSDKRGKPDFNPAPAKKKNGSYGKKNFKRKAG